MTDPSKPRPCGGRAVPFRLFGCLILAFILVGSATTATRASEAPRFSVTTASEEIIAGHILSLDPSSGVIPVEAATGNVNLEEAPEAITAWKKGAPVLVKIARAEQREHGEVSEEGMTIPRNSYTAQSGTV